MLPQPSYPSSVPKAQQFTRLRHGSVAFEAGVVLLIVLVPCLIGAVEFGRVLEAGEVVTKASRLGARTACTGGSTEAEVTQKVQTYVATSLGIPRSDVEVTYNVAAGTAHTATDEFDRPASNDLVQVTVAVDYHDVGVMTGALMNGQRISSSAAMRHK